MLPVQEALLAEACLHCGSRHIKGSESGRFHTVSCLDCGAAFVIEFDPPDAPELRGRIELVQEPWANTRRRRGVPRA
jgi:hypothetical protein